MPSLAKHHLLRAYLPLMVPFRTRFSRHEVVHVAYVQRLMGYLYTSWWSSTFLLYASRHSGVDPVDDLGDRLDPSSAARKEESQATVETHLGGQLLTQPYHKGHQGIFQQKGPTRHDRLRAEVAVRPLPWWPDGGGLLGQFRVVMLGVLQLLFHPHQGALTLGEASTMPFGRGLCHLVLVRLERLGLLVDPLLGGLQRLIELLSLALLMPVGSDNLLAALVGLERAVVVHALEAVFLHRVALAVHSWPLGRLQGVCDLRSSPGHHDRVLWGYDNHQVPGLIGPGLFPRPPIEPCAIRQAVHLGGLTALQASMLVVIEHAQQAQALVVERTRHGHGIDRAVDDKQRTPGCQGHLLAVCHNDLRQMDIGWIICHKDGLPGGIMGYRGLRARHDAAQHGDLAFVHGHPAPIGDHVTIDISDRGRLGRYQGGQQRLGSTHAFKLPQKLTQRGTVIPPAKEGYKRMLMGIERGESVDAKQRRKKQRLKAVQKRRLAMMQQGKVVA